MIAFDVVLAGLRLSIKLPAPLWAQAHEFASAAVEVASGSVAPLRLAKLAAAIRWRESEAGTAHGKDGSTGPSIVGEDGSGQGEDQFDKGAWPLLAAAKGPNGLSILYSPTIEAVLCCQHLQRDLIEFGKWAGSGEGVEMEAVCSYNAGPKAVQRAISAGKDPNSVTHGGDYGRSVLANVAAWWP